MILNNKRLALGHFKTSQEVWRVLLIQIYVKKVYKTNH